MEYRKIDLETFPRKAHLSILKHLQTLMQG